MDQNKLNKLENFMEKYYADRFVESKLKKYITAIMPIVLLIVPCY